MSCRSVWAPHRGGAAEAPLRPLRHVGRLWVRAEGVSKRPLYGRYMTVTVGYTLVGRIELPYRPLLDPSRPSCRPPPPAQRPPLDPPSYEHPLVFVCIHPSSSAAHCVTALGRVEMWNAWTQCIAGRRVVSCCTRSLHVLHGVAQCYGVAYNSSICMFR